MRVIETLGNRLKRLREEKHWKQEQIASLVDVSRSAISQYEKDIRQPPYDVLVQLSIIYRVSTDYLLGNQHFQETVINPDFVPGDGWDADQTVMWQDGHCLDGIAEDPNMAGTDEIKENRLYNFYSAVTPSELEWLWYPYIPYGKITILQGDPGDGKSTLAINLAATVTIGGELPDGQVIESPKVVIYQCTEDSSSDTIKPRLVQAGADCERIAFIVDTDERLTLDDKRIETAIAQTGARLLILDPLQSFIGQDGEMQNAGRMRNVFRALASVAEKYHCAVLLIGHMNKASGGKKIYRGLGSIDIAAAARSILMVMRDEDNPEIRYMFPVKSSLAPEGCAISFLMSKEYGFRWIGRCSIDTKELQAKAVKRKAGKKEQAKDILNVMLSEEDMPAKAVLAKMEEFGISARTARQAQKELGVAVYKKKTAWFWGLPEQTELDSADGTINEAEGKGT